MTPRRSLLLRRLNRLLTLCVIGLGAPAAARAFDSGSGCQPFIAPAEQYYRLPAGLLAAIARVESGRFGAPYPWALNIAGRSRMAPDYASAVPLLRDKAGGVRRDVAIGCLQIHMGYHLRPFRDPEWALQPRYNVWYGALFLQQLHDRYGSWREAIGHYHASDPAARRRYLCRVSRQLAALAPQTAARLELPPCADIPASSGSLVSLIMAARQRAPLQLQQDADAAATR